MSKNQFRLVAPPGVGHEEFREQIQTQLESNRSDNGCRVVKLSDDLRVAAGTTAVCVHIKAAPNSKQAAFLQRYTNATPV